MRSKVDLALAKELKDSWDNNASRWTETVRSSRIASRQLVTDSAIVNTILTRSPHSMLDVGCGEGWLCRALADHVPRIVGIDGSENLIAKACQLGGGEFIPLSYAEIRGSTILATERFDVIVANFALLDDDLPGFLDTMRGMVSDHGFLAIQTLHPSTVPPPYSSGWRTEEFSFLQGEGNWQPMPWYFRTMGDWIAGLHPHWLLYKLLEPLDPRTNQPASLILIAHPDKAHE